VESALRGVNMSVIAQRESNRVSAPDSDGQMIIVRPQVVENVGHVLGNFFQQIYHLVAETRAGDTTAGTQLAASVGHLEDFLQLVLDYFSPPVLALQDVLGTEVAQSLARQLSDTVCCPVKIEAKVHSDGRVRVDPGRLARGFALLATLLCQSTGADAGIALKAATRPMAHSLTFTVTVPRHFLAARSSQSDMRWAVAEKLLEAHGGALQRQSSPSGEVLWEIVLPLQP
jgi:hypothetical protein